MATDILPRDLSISQTIGVLVPSLQADTWSVSALSDQAAADRYNDGTLVSIERKVIPSHELLEAIEWDEWSAVPVEHQERVKIVLGLGEVNIQGANTRKVLSQAFTNALAPITRQNMGALQTTTQSPAASLGLPALTARDIAAARDWIARNS